MESQNPPPNMRGGELRESVEHDEAQPSQTQDGDAMDIDGPANEGGTPAPGAGGLTKQDYDTMKSILDQLSNYEENGRQIFHVFQRIVNRRFLPDYHDVIKKPVAFSSLRTHIIRKEYKSWAGFVQDFAQMVWNAHRYNRPRAEAYKDADKLEEKVKFEMAKLVQAGKVPKEDAEWPEMDPIPEFEGSPTPPPGEGEEEEEEDDEPEDDDDDDEDDDDSEDEALRKRRRKSGVPRSTAAIVKREGGKVEASKTAAEEEDHKKRGRPPKVHTPMEARINTILKGLRKFKDDNGHLKVVHFEKQPDKAEFPDYYETIKKPIALDIIKRKAKRKNYNSVDAVLKDLDLMFENAKMYNEENSPVWQCAVDLQKEAHILAEQERTKPDSAFVDEDGRIPLNEILYNNEVWKVGDWIHIQNPNDVTKPIVAQIYRTWQDPEGQKWINACWYYRPEQTVHQHEKHFYENEVVKTGQYRDHRIEEVVDRCYVMFFTRYFKGRPRGFPADKEVYVCEARYNEDKFKINKIKTWASCVPDEMRDKDYEMDLFDTPRAMTKFPSPIKHLLPPDAKEDDELPKPTWGAPNAPPIVGAVHRRPRESNESPPPQPIPPPEPTPPPQSHSARRPTNPSEARPQIYGSDGMLLANRASIPPPSPSPVQGHQPLSNNPYGQQFAPPRAQASPAPILPQQSYTELRGGSRPSHTPIPPSTAFNPTPVHNSAYANTYSAQANTHPASVGQPSHGNYDQGYARQIHPQSTHPRSFPSNITSANAYNPPKAVEVYTLPDPANASLPEEFRQDFVTDSQGRILFFTAPPIQRKRPALTGGITGHSLKYLAKKAKDQETIEAKRKERALEIHEESIQKRQKLNEEVAQAHENAEKLGMKAVSNYIKRMDAGTEELYTQWYGEHAKEILDADRAKLAIKQAEAQAKQEHFAKVQEERKEAHTIRITKSRFPY